MATFPHSTSPPDGGGSAAADVSVGQAPSVEEVLAHGLDLAGAPGDPGHADGEFGALRLARDRTDGAAA
ncbi:MAG: hypothetical protein OXG17_07730 [Chloroflexi bacterium]|nr:hypothetical protein [Chloroflexota bacterium]